MDSSSRQRVIKGLSLRISEALSEVEPLGIVLAELRRCSKEFALVGGFSRQLLLREDFGSLRDIDIVVIGTDLEELKSSARRFDFRTNKFGGLSFELDEVRFDVWPLQRSWGLVREKIKDPTLFDYVQHTFFNLDAIAILIESNNFDLRGIYDCGFSNSVRSKLLDINYSASLDPVGNCVKAMVTALEWNFGITWDLQQYIWKHCGSLSSEDLMVYQRSRYDLLPLSRLEFIQWMHSIRLNNRNYGAPLQLVVDDSIREWSLEDKLSYASRTFKRKLRNYEHDADLSMFLESNICSVRVSFNAEMSSCSDTSWFCNSLGRCREVY